MCDFNTGTCVKAGELIPAIVKRLYAVSAELFVEGHKLDVTPLAKRMMIICDPGFCARNGCDKDGHELDDALVAPVIASYRLLRF